MHSEGSSVAHERREADVGSLLSRKSMSQVCATAQSALLGMATQTYLRLLRRRGSVLVGDFYSILSAADRLIDEMVEG